MQLQPATTKRDGVKNIYDPEQSVRAGAHYLSDLLTRFDSPGPRGLRSSCRPRGETARDRNSSADIVGAEDHTHRAGGNFTAMSSASSSTPVE
jgi:hypothetical protein